MQRRAERDFNGQRIGGVGAHEFGDRPVQARQPRPRLHDGLDGAGKAFVVALHVGQQTDSVVKRARVHGHLHTQFSRAGGLLFPLFHAQLIAVNPVRGGLQFLPRL